MKISSTNESKLGLVFYNEKEPTTKYRATKLLYKTNDINLIVSRSGEIGKIIDRMVKKGILNYLKKLGSKPKFYELSKTMRETDFRDKEYEVKCNFCKKSSWVLEKQKEKVCTCKKPNGKKRKIRITKKRYTGKWRFINLESTNKNKKIKESEKHE